jgi:predicted ribosomally synthesized six-cysteine peptide SCIFF
MKHIKTVFTGVRPAGMADGGCGECAVSCQSACKTSCPVANQLCENQGRLQKGKKPRGNDARL